MIDRNRREFLEIAGATAAAAFLAPTSLAGAQVPSPPAGSSPLPAGPGAPFGTYQSEIYLSGMSAGSVPIFTTNLSDLEEAAAKVLSEEASRHLLGQAGGRGAVRANARALAAWRIVPRMFIDRSGRSLSTSVLGVEMPAPVILGPVANQALVHPDAESATARAAADLGLTYVHSSLASTSVEAVAAAAPGGSRWFAADWPGTDPVDTAMLSRAELAGCTHLVLGAPQPGEPWAPLAAVRAAWAGPIVISGIQTVPDARAALRHGADGIVVSNERGRRGPRPTGTIDHLPKVVKAVGGKVPVLFGSGVVSGTDVFRALALGADAVLLGRPYAHGLALAGQEGVRHMLRTLLAELEITLAIAGDGTLADLGRDALVRHQR